MIKNNTGADVGQYEVLKLDGALFTPTDNATGWFQRQTFKGITPTADCDFAITQRSVPDGKTQPAIFSGVTPCTVSVSDASHTHAIAGTTAAKLVSATSGPAKILWKESGTGDKNAVVQLSQSGGGESVKNWCTGTASGSSTFGSYQISNFYTSDPTVFAAQNLGGGFFTHVNSYVDCVGHLAGEWNYRYAGSNANYVARDGGGYMAFDSDQTAVRRVSFNAFAPLKHELFSKTAAWYTASKPFTGSKPLQSIGFSLSSPIVLSTNQSFTFVTPNVDIDTSGVLLPAFEDESYNIRFALIEQDLPDLSAMNPSGGVNPQL